MSRRTERMAEDAAQQAALASEAGRVLQQRAQERAKPEEPSIPPPVVEEGGDRRPVKAFNKVRESAMAEIEAREERVQPAVETVQRESAEIAASVVPPETPPETPPEPVVEEPPKVETVRVKVDGEEFDAPKDEVDAYGGIRAYQIAKANENRLKKTNESVAEVKKLLAQMQAASVATPPQPQVSDTQFVQSKLDAIRYGTPEEASAALLEIQQRGRPNINPMEIVSQASVQIKHDMAYAKFRTDFADVMANPMLAKLVHLQFTESLAPYVQSGHPDWQKLSQFDFSSEFTKIGNQVKSALLPRPSQPTQPSTTASPPSQPSEKEARKASIVNLPTAAARATPPAEDKPLSPEEERLAAIAAANKARGKQVG